MSFLNESSLFNKYHNPHANIAVESESPEWLVDFSITSLNEIEVTAQYTAIAKDSSPTQPCPNSSFNATFTKPGFSLIAHFILS